MEDYYYYGNEYGFYDVDMDFVKIEFVETDEIAPDRQQHKYVVVYRSKGRPKYFEIDDAQYDSLHQVVGYCAGSIYLEKQGITLYRIVKIKFDPKKGC